MPTAYSISNCVGWYVAGRGVWADVGGTTAAGHGDPVGRWDDQSGSGNHLTQPTAGSRPAFSLATAAVTAAGPATFTLAGVAAAVDRPSVPPAVVFDGSTAWLSVPATLTVPATGWTVVAATRGPGCAPVTLGDPTTGHAVAYGAFAGPPPRVSVWTPIGGVAAMPAATVWPTLSPIVHGLRCSSALGETRAYVGTNQQSAVDANYGTATLTGGSVGRAAGAADPALGNLSFAGDVLELLVFNRPLTDAAMATLLAAVQAAHGWRADANAAQLVFVGDDATAGGPGLPAVDQCYPWRLARQYGGQVKPVTVAAPGQTVAQQRATAAAVVVPLDRSPFTANVAVVGVGGADLAGGAAGADVAAAIAGLCGTLRSGGFAVVVATVTPQSAPTTAAQVTRSSAIAAANAAIRSGWSAYADALVDWAADPRLSDYTDPTYFAADGWHTTAAGDGVKAQLVKAAVDPLLTPPATPTAPLTFAAFYAPGSTFAGRFGRFPQG